MTRPDPFGVLLEEPARTAVLLDFDGSLAPIVDDPAEAAPLPGTAAVLERLARRFGRVAVVSGRPVQFLVRHLPVEGLDLVGLYGMERRIGGDVGVDPEAQPHLGRADAAADEAEAALPGVLVERKDGLTCVLHWRSQPERAADALEVGRAIAERHGLVAREGRMSLELMPPVPVDKGRVTESLCSGMAVALFAGDDRGDLEAFAALDRLVGEGRLRAAVKIAVRSREAPPELLTSADERVAGPEELVEMLRRLAA